MKNLSKFISLVVLLTAAPYAMPAGTTSKYLQLTADQQVAANTVVPLLTTTVQLPSAGWVYVQSDGRYFPNGAASANTYITINGQQVSNDSYIDWTQSNAKQQHSFNVIGARNLAAGSYTVTLYARAGQAPVYFGGSTNLSVMTSAASKVSNTGLAADSPVLNFDTVGTAEGSPLDANDRSTLVSSVVGNTSGPIVALASGRAYVSGNYGDAMLGIFLNNQEPNIDSMTWSINDLYTGAENQAPLYSQALFAAPPAQSTVQFIATESPYWSPQDPQTNNVKYKFGAGSRLITLNGGMSVVGKGLTPGFNYTGSGQNRRFAYVCVAATQPWPGCPATGTEVVLGTGRVCIPSGHNGVVLFSTKSRMQGDSDDTGGTIFLYLKVNGQVKGSLGVQQFGPAPNGVSVRTITSSYMAAGAQALPVGCHTVQAVARGQGDFKHLVMNADMPLLWFD